MSRAAMILAAGFGMRMGAMVRDTPKVLLTVNGKPLLDHAIVAAGEAHPKVVNGHYLADQVREHLNAHHPSVQFSHETPDILDSGGAIKQALPRLRAEPILTVNADAVWRGPVAHGVLEAQWDPTVMGALLLLVPMARAVARQGGGDFAFGADGRLSWDKGPDGWVYTGAQIIQTDAIAVHPNAAFSLVEIWDGLMAEGRLYGVEYPGSWADVGHPEGLAAAEAMGADHV